jgi:hypothetical protein
MSLPYNTNNGKKTSYYFYRYDNTFWVTINKNSRNLLMSNGVWAKTFEKSDKDKINELEQRIK